MFKLSATLLACALLATLVGTARAYKEHEFKTMAQCEQMKESYNPQSWKEARYQLCFKTMNGVLHRSPEGKLVTCTVPNLAKGDYTYQCQPVPMPKNLKPWQRAIVDQAKPLEMPDPDDTDRRDWSGYGLANNNRAQMLLWANLAGRAASCGEDILDFAHRVDTAIDRSIGSGDGALDKRTMFRGYLLVALYRYLPDPREKSDALIARVQRELNYEHYRIPGGALGAAQSDHDFFRRAGLPKFNNERDCAAVKAQFAETLKRLPPQFIITEPSYSDEQQVRYQEQLMPAVLCSIDIEDAYFRVRRWIMQVPPRQLARVYALENLGMVNAEAADKVTLPRDCPYFATQFLQMKLPDGPGAEAWLQRYPAPWGPGRQRRADYFAELDRIDRWAKTAAKALWCDQDAQVREFIEAAELWIDKRVWQKYGKERFVRRFRRSMDFAWLYVEPEGWWPATSKGKWYNPSPRAKKTYELKFKPLVSVGPLNQRLRVVQKYDLPSTGSKLKEQLKDPPIKLPGDCPGVAKELAATLAEAKAPVEPPEPVFAQRIGYTGTPQVCRPAKVKEECIVSEKLKKIVCTAPKEKKYFVLDAEGYQSEVRYTDHGDGTVSTGGTEPGEYRYIWKKCPEGLSGPQCKSGKARLFGWEEALEYAKTHTFAGQSGWQVPVQGTLATLLDFNCYNPSIDTKLFPNTPSGLFLGDLNGQMTGLMGPCVASPESGQKALAEMRDFARLKEAEKRSKDDGQGERSALHSRAEVGDFA